MNSRDYCLYLSYLAPKKNCRGLPELPEAFRRPVATARGRRRVWQIQTFSSPSRGRRTSGPLVAVAVGLNSDWLPGLPSATVATRRCSSLHCKSSFMLCGRDRAVPPSGSSVANQRALVSARRVTFNAVLCPKLEGCEKFYLLVVFPYEKIFTFPVENILNTQSVRRKYAFQYIYGKSQKQLPA